MAQGMDPYLFTGQGWAGRCCGVGMFDDQFADGVAPECLLGRGWEDSIGLAAAAFIGPGAHGHNAVFAQRRDSFFASLAEYPEVGGTVGVDVGAPERGDLRYSQPGLDGHHQLNAKPSFRTTLSCDATGTGLYLHKHTRPALNPLRRKDGSV